jgi:hypothetical protein
LHQVFFFYHSGLLRHVYCNTPGASWIYNHHAQITSLKMASRKHFGLCQDVSCNP